MGGKEEETGVGRRREEGFINVSYIYALLCNFYKHRFMSNGHVVINQPMLNTIFTWRPQLYVL